MNPNFIQVMENPLIGESVVAKGVFAAVDDEGELLVLASYTGDPKGLVSIQADGELDAVDIRKLIAYLEACLLKANDEKVE